jgi:ribosomal protein L7/L12
VTALDLGLAGALASALAALAAALAAAARTRAENQRLRRKLADLAAGGAWSTAAVLQAARETTAPVLPVDVQSHIQRTLIEGRSIDAIRQYRQATGLGLKEAKDAIDAMRRALGV